MGFGLHSGIFLCFSPVIFFMSFIIHVFSCLIIIRLLLIKSSVYPVLGSQFYVIYKSNSFT